MNQDRYKVFFLYSMTAFSYTLTKSIAGLSLSCLYEAKEKKKKLAVTHADSGDVGTRFVLFRVSIVGAVLRIAKTRQV